MAWDVVFTPSFKQEFDDLSVRVQDGLLTHVGVLEQLGPQLGRPYVDTLKGSRYTNMKEIRFRADGGVWRVAFAFDPKRKAILLVAGDKSGANERRFYQELIKKADERFAEHLGHALTKNGVDDYEQFQGGDGSASP